MTNLKGVSWSTNVEKIFNWTKSSEWKIHGWAEKKDVITGDMLGMFWYCVRKSVINDVRFTCPIQNN